MIQINLLPWRQHNRQIQKGRLTVLFGATVGLVLLFLIIVHIYYEAKVNHQLSLNSYLQTQISEQQAASDALNAQEKDKIIIKDKMRYISGIITANYNVVRLFNELTTLVPAGVNIKSFSRNQNKISLQGWTTSDSDITKFMQDIAHSSLFFQPVLTEINSDSQSSGSQRGFKIDVEQRG